jgi:hypothetical protein
VRLSAAIGEIRGLVGRERCGIADVRTGGFRWLGCSCQWGRFFAALRVVVRRPAARPALELWRLVQQAGRPVQHRRYFDGWLS